MGQTGESVQGTGVVWVCFKRFIEQGAGKRNVSVVDGANCARTHPDKTVGVMSRCVSPFDSQQIF